MRDISIREAGHTATGDQKQYNPVDGIDTNFTHTDCDQIALTDAVGTFESAPEGRAFYNDGWQNQVTGHGPEDFNNTRQEIDAHAKYARATLVAHEASNTFGN